MDGIHDVGGEQGFGRVEPTAEEPPFKQDWEARLVGIFCYVIPNSFLVSVLVIFASPLCVFGVRRITDLDGADEPDQTKASRFLLTNSSTVIGCRPPMSAM